VGFRIVIFPGIALSAALTSVTVAMEELKEKGTVKKVEGKGLSPRKLFEVCGLDECLAFDREAGGVAFGEGV
jgi:methylisocitrate lyase